MSSREARASRDGERKVRRTGLVFALFVASLVPLSGCATSSQARKVKATGFLGDYRSLLQPGKRGEEELLVYKNPEATWATYTKILFEPVTIWVDPDAKRKLSKDERKDLERLAESFHATLRQKLSADYEMVDTPGPGTIRIQAAITNGQGSNTLLKIASKGVPYGTGPSALWTFITGKPLFVGEASIEFMIKDAETGGLLLASADRRVGVDTIVGQKSINTEYLNTWGDVKNSLDFWSDAEVYRLCVLRGAKTCVKPKAGIGILN